MKAATHKVALAPFLSSCPEVITLGIRATLDEYPEVERELLRRAKRIFFPTSRFTEVFHAGGKLCFPSYFSYRYQHSRILQFTLLDYLQQPHPRTRFYFGNRQKARIPEDFRYPFVLMGPQVKPGTKHLIRDLHCLEKHAAKYNPVIIQEYGGWTERIQLVCVHYDCVATSRRTSNSLERSPPEPIPTEHTDYRRLLQQTRRLLRTAQIDDIEVVWVRVDGGWQLVDMRRPPVRMESPHGPINRHEHICRLIQRGLL